MDSNNNTMWKLLFFGAFGLLLIVSIFAYLETTENPYVKPYSPLAFFTLTDYSEYGSDLYVNATGTWVSDTSLAFPTQTSEISCYRESNYCVESRASLDTETKYLMVDQFSYNITSWTSDTINARLVSDGVCTDFTLTFNRKQKQVTATRTTKDSNDSSCAMLDKTPIHMYLSDGKRL